VRLEDMNIGPLSIGTEFSSLSLREAKRNLIQLRHTETKKTTLYQVAKEVAAGIVEKPKTKKKQPWREIDPKMAATIICRLTINKTQHSIRSIVKDFGIDDKYIRKIQKKGSTATRRRSAISFR
jgi:hypothetical protein